VGQNVDQLVARETPTGTVGWYLTDRLGSVRDIVNDSGQVLDHIDYDAFGNITVETNPALGGRYKFTSRDYDAVTGLYFNFARYYDPQTGSWTSEDPMGFAAGDVNLYRYVSNDATNMSDPSGLQSWGAWLQDQASVASAAAGAFVGSVVSNVAGGVTALATGEAGQALGERAVKMVENQTGQAFTGTTSEWVKFGTAVGGDLAGTNQIVEGVGGYDLATQEELSAEERIQRGATGVGILAGNAAGGLALAAKAPAALPTLSRLGNTTIVGGAASRTGAVAGETAAAEGVAGPKAGVSVATGTGSGAQSMTVVRAIGKGERVADLINEAKTLTYTTGNEHAVVTLADGTRAIVSGGEGGITFAEGQVTRIFGHTHPYQLPPTGPSGADFAALELLGQRSSYVLEHGQLIRF
jgi:RHS repeat-associated protein